MLGIVVIFQLSLIAGSLAGTGLRFSKDLDPTAFAVFKGWNAKTNGTLRFHFRTKNENSFLIYADDTGQCEFIYLSLVDGRFRLRLKMGNCKETQTLLVGHNLADGKWHKVLVQRNYSITSATVDDQLTNSTYYDGHDYDIFGVKSDLLVGGIPLHKPFNDFSFPAIIYESSHLNRFYGCISGIMYNNGRGPLKEAHLKNTSGTIRGCLDPCSQSDQCLNGGICRDTVSEVWCDCKGTGYEGPNCKEEATSVWMNGSGYIVFSVDTKEEKLHSNYSYIAFRLRTEMPDGIIFSLQSDSDNDYLLIETVHGKLRVDVDLGQGELVLQGIHVHDDEWHWIEFSRRGRTVTLKFDGKTLADGKMSGKSYQLNVKGPQAKVYLGGGPRNVFTKSQSKMNLTGQLREFYFRDMKLLDYAVPTITDKRFATVGTVIDGSTVVDTSGSTPDCDQMNDDEDASFGCTTTERPTYQTDEVMSSTSEPTSDPGFAPSAAQAYLSLPQVVPFWVISVIVIVAAICILVTIYFLYRWNTRYSGSFKPEQTSSSGDLPQHIAQVQNSKPRIYVTAHNEKV